jgi:hypothetical protein
MIDGAGKKGLSFADIAALGKSAAGTGIKDTASAILERFGIKPKGVDGLKKASESQAPGPKLDAQAVSARQPAMPGSKILFIGMCRGQDNSFAVRSSTVGEDLPTSSGAYDNFLRDLCTGTGDPYAYFASLTDARGQADNYIFPDEVHATLGNFFDQDLDGVLFGSPKGYVGYEAKVPQPELSLADVASDAQTLSTESQSRDQRVALQRLSQLASELGKVAEGKKVDQKSVGAMLDSIEMVAERVRLATQQEGNRLFAQALFTDAPSPATQEKMAEVMHVQTEVMEMLEALHRALTAQLDKLVPA